MIFKYFITINLGSLDELNLSNCDVLERIDEFVSLEDFLWEEISGEVLEELIDVSLAYLKYIKLIEPP